MSSSIRQTEFGRQLTASQPVYRLAKPENRIRMEVCWNKTGFPVLQNPASRICGVTNLSRIRPADYANRQAEFMLLAFGSISGQPDHSSGKPNSKVF